MDLSKKSPENATGNFKIVDAFSVFLLTLLAVFIYFYSASTLANTTSKEIFTMVSIGSIIVLLPIMYRIKATWNGVSFDLNSRKLSFPGGGLSADGIGDYFRPAFLMQYFKRITVDLDDIQQIGIHTKWTTTAIGILSLLNKNGDKERLLGYLTLTGDFGTAEVKFASIPKCKQAYASLSYYLSLGEPVVVR